MTTVTILLLGMKRRTLEALCPGEGWPGLPGATTG